MRRQIALWFLLLGFSLSTVAQEVPRGIFFGPMPVKARFNDVLDIFGDKMALYDPEDNMLILQDGFNYRLPEGFVTFNTGAPLRIRLAGRVYMEAAVVSKDPIVIESTTYSTLTIVSNGSATALKCPRLVIDDYFTSVRLYSDAPNMEMIALKCPGEVVVNGGALRMEVSRSPKAAEINTLTLNGSVMETPSEITVNEYGVICDHKGRYARLVSIVPEP